MNDKKTSSVKRDIQTVDDWYKILNWEKLPNFASCHHMKEYSEFNKNYYSCDEIIRLQTNIFEKYKYGNISSVRLMGDPGAGKTSFLYYLLHEATNNHSELKELYRVHLFSVSKADDINHYERIIKKEIIIALKTFFIEIELSSTFKKLYDRTLSPKENINSLLGYLDDNSEKIPQKLIFVMDDVDLLDNNIMEKIARTVQIHLDNINVIKWISVRGATYDRYPKKLKDLLGEFYPSVYKMPNTTLYSIIQHRINQQTKCKGKNPFSKKLCDERVDPLLDFNKRRSLSMLRSIIEDTLPQKTSILTAEKFIQNFVESSSINSLMQKGALPNIHANFMRSISFYPLPLDIILCMQFTSNSNIIFGSINDIAITRSNKSKVWDDSRIIKIRESDFTFTINAFETEGLVLKLSKNNIELTARGKIVSQYVQSSDFYHKTCKAMIMSIDQVDNYWDFLNVNINHEKVVADHLSWENVYYTDN